MMWIFFFCLFMGLILKDFMFHSNWIMVDVASVMMVSLGFLIIFNLFSFSFPMLSLGLKLVYFYLYLLVVIFLSFCFFSFNPMFYLVFLEFSVIPLSILIMNFSKDFDKFYSLVLMLFINLFGSLPFMFFSLNFMLLFFNFSYIKQSFYNYIYDLEIFFFFFLILVCKVPIIFSHFWLTKAHVSSSGACSMVLASLMLKLGTMGLYKFSSFFSLKILIFHMIVSVSMLGNFFITMVMIRFFDVKFLIACSSISHMSMIFPLSVMGLSLGLNGSLMMMLSHGIVSLFLFFMVTLFYECYFNRSISFFKATETWSKIMSMVFFFYVILNMGLPPFMNFYSEFLFLMSVLKISLFLTFFFFLSLVSLVMIVMFLLCNYIFGKKLILSESMESSMILYFSFKYLVIIFFFPFVF